MSDDEQKNKISEEVEMELSTKKKKKKVVTQENQDDLLELGKKKKKKTTEGEEAEKKKKKKKKAQEEEEEPVKEDNADVELLIEQLKKKKNKKKENNENSYWTGGASNDPTNNEEQAEKKELSIIRDGDFGPESWTKSDRDYKYAELLDRIVTMLKKKNPELGTGKKKKIKIKPPQVVRDGPKRTIFTNFDEICTNLSRDREHVLQFLLSELGASGNLDGNNSMVIRGAFFPKHIENVLRKYLSEYVICSVCGNLDTILTRDANTRLYSLNCMSCNASKTVQAVKQGYIVNFTPRRKRA